MRRRRIVRRNYPQVCDATFLLRHNGGVPAAPATRRRRRVSRRVQLARRRALAGLTLVVLVGVIVAFALTRPGEAEGETPPGSAPAPAPATSIVRPSPTTHPASEQPDSSPTRPAPSPSICDDPGVRDALKGGTDEEVVDAVGGGVDFREAVVSGEAPCLDLGEAGRVWTVVNKRNPLDPLDYWPTPQAQPNGIRVVSGGGWLRADAAAAIDELASAIVADGVGTLGIDSAFRPYAFQVDLYDRAVASRGREAADLRSARPGHSEHQTGLAVDLVACGAAGCGSHDGFRGTAHAQWLVDNAWRHGFIVRYEEGETDTTGYDWEPWHLRYIGTQLAAVYHEGGYRTLEEFFDLPAAPDYGE